MGTKRKSLRKRKLFRSSFENQRNFFFFTSLSRNGLFECHSQRDVLFISIRSTLPNLSSIPLGSSGSQSDLQSVDFVEIKACVELLEEENIQLPSWICFSSVDGLHASSGESFNECSDILNKCDKVNVVGINCTPPQFIGNLICKFREEGAGMT